MIPAAIILVLFMACYVAPMCFLHRKARKRNQAEQLLHNDSVTEVARIVSARNIDISAMDTIALGHQLDVIRNLPEHEPGPVKWLPRENDSIRPEE